MRLASGRVPLHYPIFDKELLAIIRPLTEWRHHLEGTIHPVVIWTDHQNLTYFQNMQKLNHCQACWSLFLSHFNFQLHHCPGKSAGKEDTLS